MASPLPRRRLTLLDAMILVIATAGGLGIVREFVLTLRGAQGPTRPTVGDWAALSTWVVSFWMIALLILRFRGLHPPLRTIGRQPGVAACIAGLLALSFQFLYLLPTTRLPRYGLPALYYLMMSANTGHASSAIASAWAVLALSGLWSASEDWIDRLGRVLGLLTILTFTFLTVSRWWGP